MASYTSITGANWQPLRLHPQTHTLSLEQILESFSAPITEEHAFAIVHQCIKCLNELNDSLNKLRLLESTKDILIHKDGKVHHATYVKEDPYPPKMDEAGCSPSKGDCLNITEDKIIASLGLVIYGALDFGVKDKEERSLTPGLENLLGLMISNGDSDQSADDSDSSGDPVSCSNSLRDTDDEGIEKDHGYEDDSSASSNGSSKIVRRNRKCPKKSGNNGVGHSVKKVLSVCAKHLSVSSEAENHFRAVCRALVSESLELSTFLARARLKDDEHSEELHNLAIQDWAHLWIQTMHELRQGVKLKKTNFTKTPIEYELTPYEILMDDIRSRRYKLNKVMVDGEIPPKIKKDAHDVILEFIRSRPPLTPASHRQLKPIEKYVTPQERLMESIRNSHKDCLLRKTSGPPEPRNVVLESVKNIPCLVPIKTAKGNCGTNQEKSKPEKPKRAKLLDDPSSPLPVTPIPGQEKDETDSLSSIKAAKKVIKPNFVFDPDNDDDDEVFNSPVTAREETPDKQSVQIRVVPGRRSVQFNPSPMEEGKNKVILKTHSTLISSSSQNCLPESATRRNVPRRCKSIVFTNPSSSPELSPILPRRSTSIVFNSSVQTLPEISPVLPSRRSTSTNVLNSVSRRHSALILSVPYHNSKPDDPPVKPQFQTGESSYFQHAFTTSPGKAGNSFVSQSYHHDKSNLNNSYDPESIRSKSYQICSSQFASMTQRNFLRKPSLSPQVDPGVKGRQLLSGPSILRKSRSDYFPSLSSNSINNTNTNVQSSYNNISQFNPSDVVVTRPNHFSRNSSSTTPLRPDRFYNKQLYYEDLSPLVVSGLTRTARQQVSSPTKGGSNGRSLSGRFLTPGLPVQAQFNRPKFLPRRQLPRLPEDKSSARHLTKTEKFEQWAQALQTLDLTLGEVVHIRSVLTKAELEGLTLDCNLREDLEKGKICFLCMKIKFGIFNWSYTCQLCKHVVCSSCLTKMKIPSEKFQHIPVFELSPYQITHGGEDKYKNYEDSGPGDPFFKVRRNSSSSRFQENVEQRKSIGSVSIHLDRKTSFVGQDVTPKRGRSKLQRSKTMNYKQKPENVLNPNSGSSSGTQINVCLDCKEMILQIIRTQRASRRAQFTKSLCLSEIETT